VLVCRYFDYSKETENENKYFENCETLPPWAGKLHCIRFEQENMARRDSKRIETNKQGFPTKCLHCFPLKCAKHRNICANTASSFFD
jgi:hypothetical protein